LGQIYGNSNLIIGVPTYLLLVFTYHVIKPKNRNHSINKVTNKGYEKKKKCKQLRQELGLCCFSFASYSDERFTQIYRAFYLFLLKRNLITLELRPVEINISSSARIVQLAKNKS